MRVDSSNLSLRTSDGGNRDSNDGGVGGNQPDNAVGIMVAPDLCRFNRAVADGVIFILIGVHLNKRPNCFIGF